MEIELPVSVFREGPILSHIHLRLTCLLPLKHMRARKSVSSNLIPIFMEELIKKGTMDEYLESLGWRKIQRSGYRRPLSSKGLRK